MSRSPIVDSSFILPTRIVAPTPLGLMRHCCCLLRIKTFHLNPFNLNLLYMDLGIKSYLQELSGLNCTSLINNHIRCVHI